VSLAVSRRWALACALGLLVRGGAAAQEAGTAGGFPYGDPSEVINFLLVLRATDHMFVLALPSQEGGNPRIIATLLTREIPSKGDLNFTSRLNGMREAVERSLQTLAPRPERLFGVTRAVAFTGPSVRVLLLICDRCETFTLMRPTPAARTGFVQSPQYPLFAIAEYLPPPRDDGR